VSLRCSWRSQLLLVRELRAGLAAYSSSSSSSSGGGGGGGEQCARFPDPAAGYAAGCWYAKAASVLHNLSAAAVATVLCSSVFIWMGPQVLVCVKWSL
jgi:hypothetical protein